MQCYMIRKNTIKDRDKEVKEKAEFIVNNIDTKSKFVKFNNWKC